MRLMSQSRPLEGSLKALRTFGVVFLALAAVSHAATEAKPQIWNVELEPDERFGNAHVAVLEAATDAVGQRYIVKGLKVIEPVSVIVVTATADEQVDVALLKWSWDDPPERNGSTRGSGKVQFDFRTEGDLLIDVRSPAETPYQLVVWKGPELPVLIRDGFVSPKEFARRRRRQAQGATGAGGTSPPLLMATGLLGGVVVVLAAVVLRRKAS
jgi:hypothetical protein